MILRCILRAGNILTPAFLSPLASFAVPHQYQVVTPIEGDNLVGAVSADAYAIDERKGFIPGIPASKSRCFPDFALLAGFAICLREWRASILRDIDKPDGRWTILGRTESIALIYRRRVTSSVGSCEIWRPKI